MMSSAQTLGDSVCHYRIAAKLTDLQSALKLGWGFVETKTEIPRVRLVLLSRVKQRLDQVLKAPLDMTILELLEMQ